MGLKRNDLVTLNISVISCTIRVPVKIVLNAADRVQPGQKGTAGLPRVELG